MLKVSNSYYILLFFALSIILIQGNPYAQEAKFQQLDNDIGLVSMEAENFSEEFNPGEAYWEFIEDPEWYSGENAFFPSAFLNNSPVLISKATFAASLLVNSCLPRS